MAKSRQFKRFEADDQPRFLTFSCEQRLQLLGTPILRDHFMHHLVQSLTRHPVTAIAWVVMPEHVHLILRPNTDGAITAFLNGLKRPFSQSVLKRWRELNAPVLARLCRPDGSHRFWQTGGGYDRVLHGDELFEKIAYCHQNPIRRGLISTSTDWAWSSARRYAGLGDPLGPVIDLDQLPSPDRPLV